MRTATMIKLGIPAENAGGEAARRYARFIMKQYDNDVGDIDFGNDTARELFAKYLARVANGNDTMRGYWAAFNRRPLLG